MAFGATYSAHACPKPMRTQSSEDERKQAGSFNFVPATPGSRILLQGPSSSHRPFTVTSRSGTRLAQPSPVVCSLYPRQSPNKPPSPLFSSHTQFYVTCAYARPVLQGGLFPPLSVQSPPHLSKKIFWKTKSPSNPNQDYHQQGCFLSTSKILRRKHG